MPLRISSRLVSSPLLVGALTVSLRALQRMQPMCRYLNMMLPGPYAVSLLLERRLALQRV